MNLQYNNFLLPCTCIPLSGSACETTALFPNREQALIFLLRSQRRIHKISRLDRLSFFADKSADKRKSHAAGAGNDPGDDPYYCGLRARVPNFAKNKACFLSLSSLDPARVLYRFSAHQMRHFPTSR